MDDTQQTPQPQPTEPVTPAADPLAPVADVSSLNDVAAMTPPPAPVMPDPLASVQDAASPAPMGDPVAADAPVDDYSYAEDVLNEILDSLDRIEARLDAMEKKLG